MLSKTRWDKIKDILIPCGCGCGEKINQFDRRGRERSILKGHTFKGKRMTDESRKRMSESHTGKQLSPEHKSNISLANSDERHYEWKGDSVGYDALHKWVKKILKKPKLCQLCNKFPPEELANITGVYNRRLENWEYLCIKCHRWFDWVVKDGFWVKAKGPA